MKDEINIEFPTSQLNLFQDNSRLLILLPTFFRLQRAWLQLTFSGDNRNQQRYWRQTTCPVRIVPQLVTLIWYHKLLRVACWLSAKMIWPWLPWRQDTTPHNILSLPRCHDNRIQHLTTSPLRCKNGGWPTKLPRASIIFCFHNENLVVLLRSIYSVLMRTPPELLADIIVVDDASTDAHREFYFSSFGALRFKTSWVYI